MLRHLVSVLTDESMNKLIADLMPRGRLTIRFVIFPQQFDDERRPECRAKQPVKFSFWS